MANNLVVEDDHNMRLLLTAYEPLGTLFLMIVVLVSTNTFLYRKRLQEIHTLPEAISRVANGDYHYRISIQKAEPMGQIYEDFNKMSC